FERLTTIGQACRAILRETLRTTLTWAMQHVCQYGWTSERVVAYLGLTEV
ncbi:MAG TPA: IS701 family transposase, partial [Gemmataceae bacterium]